MRVRTPLRLATPVVFSLLFIMLLLVPAAVRAQQPRAITAADYQRAERFMGYNVAPLVSGGAVRPSWLPGDRFWYRTPAGGGMQFVVVDPVRRTRTAAFDTTRLASAVSAALATTFDLRRLGFAQIEWSHTGDTLSFDVGTQRVRCDLRAYRCTAAARPAGAPPSSNVSPDGTKAVFIRDWNLWLEDLTSGRETQLTTDGVPNFGYATDNAGWKHSDRAIVTWSPDSKKLATFQQDQRGTGEMYLVETKVGHPVLQAWKYPLPGDSVITMIQPVIIDLSGAAPRVVRLQLPPQQHRSTICDDVACRGESWTDTEWYPDGSRLALVSTSRDHKHEVLRIADASTGAVRDVLEETSPTQFESGFDMVNWHVLPESNEVLWFSERDNWGHLYLYDLTTGKLKQKITTGDWPVLQVLRVDPKLRTIWFVGAGREAGDPYFRHLYSIRFDGSQLRLLTPDSADHDVSIAPDGRYFVDSYSTPTLPAVAVVRDAQGRVVMPLERADISRLLATGWKPPVPITVKARDGKTDLYGLMFVPTNIDSTRKYPIINHIYPGPQTGSVGGRQFSAARGDAQALAELGFVVVEIDGLGTPMRSKSFHDAYYGDMGDNTLPDQIAGMKQLAQRYPFIDLERAGIYGHSGGGFATADAMFRYPDFFKVGISESGNHDNREYEDDWGERYQGLLEELGDGKTNYDDQANQNHAQNLKGKLLLAHGTIDDNVPPYNTFLVVDALVRANRDFDLLMLPNRHHGYADYSDYMTRRRWDYFVKNLMGAEPPKEYQMHAAAAGQRAARNRD